MRKFSELFRVFFKALISLYQWMLSPIFGGQCRFYPTCSEYALQCLDHYHPFQACLVIFKRILKCHPFHKGGIDWVPESPGGTRDAGRLS